MKKIHPNFKFSLAFLILNLTLISLNLSCKTSSQIKSTSDLNENSHQQTLQSLVTKNEGEISILAFNVENLFDTVHDAGTEDYTNLPLSEKNKPEIKKFCDSIKNNYYREECFTKDWNEDILQFKLSQVSKVIRHIDSGKGPDILLLSEVENIKILERLFKKELKDLGYKTVALIEGPDLRGIDPGFASKFPLKGKPQLHIIPYKDANPEKLKIAQRSRGILEATVVLPNKKEITFLVGHLPSQANPTEWRKQAIEFVTAKAKELQSKGKSIIAGGDFNITAEEEKEFGYFANILSTQGSVSHLVDCKSCEGTHNYKGSWSFLDILFFGNQLEKNGISLVPDSVQVVKVAHHLKRNGAPLSFRYESKEGVSDHFPLYARLKLNK